MSEIPFVVVDSKTGEAISRDLYLADNHYREDIKRVKARHRIAFQNSFSSRGLAVPTYNTPLD